MVHFPGSGNVRKVGPGYEINRYGSTICEIFLIQKLVILLFRYLKALVEQNRFFKKLGKFISSASISENYEYYIGTIHIPNNSTLTIYFICDRKRRICFLFGESNVRSKTSYLLCSPIHRCGIKVSLPPPPPAFTSQRWRVGGGGGGGAFFYKQVPI